MLCKAVRFYAETTHQNWTNNDVLAWLQVSKSPQTEYSMLRCRLWLLWTCNVTKWGRYSPRRACCISFPADRAVRNFFIFGEEEYCHAFLARFFSGRKWCTQYSSLGTIRYRKPSSSASKSRKSVSQTSSQRPSDRDWLFWYWHDEDFSVLQHIARDVVRRAAVLLTLRQPVLWENIDTVR